MPGFFDIEQPKEKKAPSPSTPDLKQAGVILDALELFLGEDPSRTYLSCINIKKAPQGRFVLEATDSFSVLRVFLDEGQFRAWLDAVKSRTARPEALDEVAGVDGFPLDDRGLLWCPRKQFELGCSDTCGWVTGERFPYPDLDRFIPRDLPHGPGDRESVRPFIAFAQLARVEKLYRLLDIPELTYSNFHFGGPQSPTLEHNVVTPDDSRAGNNGWTIEYELVVMPCTVKNWM